jgi:FtsP/CotA-like multicopper oxidase with cupredoxin domain
LRWRIVNAASARYVRLSIGGAPFRVIATDGGLIESPVEVTEILLPPADRFDILVGPFAEGQTLAIEALRYDRTTIRGRGTERFATLQVGPARPSVARIPDRLRVIEPLAAPDAAPTRTITMSVGLSLRRRCCRSTAPPRPSAPGRTSSTCRRAAPPASPGSRTTAPAPGCTTATSSSITPRG